MLPVHILVCYLVQSFFVFFLKLVGMEKNYKYFGEPFLLTFITLFWTFGFVKIDLVSFDSKV